MNGKRHTHLHGIMVLAMLAVLITAAYSIPVAAEQKTITVVDGLGREVRLKGPAQRICVNYGVAGTMISALGVKDRIVGMDPAMQSQPVLVLFPKGHKKLNVEDAIALNTDLVLVSGRDEEQIRSMESRGVTVFAVVAETTEQLKNTMLNLGKAVGKDDVASNFVKYYDSMLDRIGKKTSGLKDQDRPSVYLAGSNVLSTCSESMYQHYVIETAGGRNVAAHATAEAVSPNGWIQISPEQIVKWNPDVIVVVRYCSNATPEQIMNDKRFSGTNAVKHGRVCWFPSNLVPWDYPSPTAILGIEWMAKLLHPGLFADLDVKKETDQLFKMLYGKTFAELGGAWD